MLFPQVSLVREIGAAISAFVVGAAVGLGCYKTLNRLSEKGRVGRFVAQFCSWWLGIGAGIAAAVAVGGAYVFAGPVRGVWITDPITLRQGVGTAGAMALAYSLFGLSTPVSRHQEPRSRSDV